jgi:two-component system chemotaxis sensor kinase CheA
MSGNEQYLALFVEETREQLELFNNLLLTLEKDQADVNALIEIFRVAHTLKGMAGAMGFEAMKNLTHRMEDVFGEMKSGHMELLAQDMDTLFSCLDALSADLGAIEGGSYDDTPHTTLCEVLEDKLKGESEGLSSEAMAAATLVVDESRPNPTWLKRIVDNAEQHSDEHLFWLHVSLRENVALPSVRAFMVQEVLSAALAKVLGTLPDLEADAEHIGTHLFYVIQTKSSDDSYLQGITKNILGVSEIEAVHIEPIAATEAQDSAAEISPTEASESVPPAHTTRKTESTEVAVATTEPKAVGGPAEKGTDKIPAEKAASTAAGGDGSGKTVRISMDRIDKMVNLVGELVIDKTRLDQFVSENRDMQLVAMVNSLSNVTSELQELVMKFRMEPIERMFSRFPRVLRDLCRMLGKQVDLVMEGEETEVDRVVNEELPGAMIHVIRNAIDHGIESPEQRKAAGKPEKGTVKLTASNFGDSTTVVISDDGGGINHEKVLKKAIQNGLVTEEQAAALTPHEICQMIFLPGFSTAEVTTDVSGRGVGMDVVKTTVEKLGGQIDIYSEPGQGSRFVITLPSSMAIINVLLVRVGEETYAVPLSVIKEVVECPADDLRMVQQLEMVMVRNNPIPLLRMQYQFQHSDDVNQEKILGVIVSVRDREYCLQVDSLIGQQEAVVKSMPQSVSSNKVFSGVMTLPSGEVCLILNPSLLVNDIKIPPNLAQKFAERVQKNQHHKAKQESADTSASGLTSNRGGTACVSSESPAEPAVSGSSLIPDNYSENVDSAKLPNNVVPFEAKPPLAVI